MRHWLRTGQISGRKIGRVWRISESELPKLGSGETQVLAPVVQNERGVWKRTLKETVRPAGTLLAQAVEQIESAGVAGSTSARRELAREVAALRKHIEGLEKILQQDS